MKKYNWPKPDVSLISKATEHGRGFADLTARSPVPLNPCHTARDYLAALFDPNPKSFVCVADGGPQTACTIPWEGVEPSDRPGLVVPSLMNAIRGKKPNGDTSRRLASMVSKRLYIVLETDFKLDDPGAEPTPIGELMRNNPHLPTPKELSAGIAHHWIDQGWPVALVLFSGNKSVHVWIATWQDEDDEAAARMFAYATARGADASHWTLCQLIRCPEGRRETGEEQPVLYIDPRFMLGELPVIDY
jgi:hypothetical protein